MKFYTNDGTEVSIQEFSGRSVVIARVTKEILKEEFLQLVKNNSYINDEFAAIGITLIWCPAWIEFKEWK